VGTVLVVAGSVGAVVVSVSTTVEAGSVVGGSGAAVGPSAVAPGAVSGSRRSGRRVRLGREPVGSSVTPEKTGRPLRSPPPQPPRTYPETAATTRTGRYGYRAGDPQLALQALGVER
jgi:hypothetical protein